ncbi:uncharacterized protein batf2 [Centroberyx gerrardi]
MPPLFMETGSESSVSAEEHQSNTAGSGRREARKPGDKRGKRKEKNRDAARKSRKKQTERADELHEELQGLERSNSALEKEIAALKRDHLLYSTALERHEPLCLLRSSGSSPPTRLPASPSPAAAHQTCSSPSPVPLQNSYAGFPAPFSLSTFLTSNPGLPTLNCTHQSPSTPVPTTNASSPSTCSSTDLFASSGPSTRPSVSSSTVPAPHSLFGEGPPPLTSSQPTPVYTSLISNLIPSTSPLSGQGTSLVVSANAPLSQTNSAVLPSCSHTVPPGPHSDLVDACPLDDTQTTSSNFYGPVPGPGPGPGLSPQQLPLCQHPPSLPPSADPSRDLSLFEFLECNDWILGSAAGERNAIEAEVAPNTHTETPENASDCPLLKNCGVVRKE